MKISTLMLAEHVTVTGGLVGILNGSASLLGRPAFPARLELQLVCVVDMPVDFVAHTPVDFEVQVKNADTGFAVAQTGGEFSAALREGGDSRTLTATLTIDLRPVPIPSPGTYVVTARVGGGEEYDRFFQVVGTSDLPGGL